jgi:hypothetical protein
MNIEHTLPPEEIHELRARWTTPEGERVRTRLLNDLRAKDMNLPYCLADLPATSAGAPDPHYGMILDDLRGLDLEGEDLPGAYLNHADLSYANLRNCRLEGICLQFSLLDWADFGFSQLQSADLLQVTARHVNFEGCNLNNSMMMTGDFRASSFKNASLVRCCLNGAKFNEADLIGANFDGAEAHSTLFPAGFALKPNEPRRKRVFLPRPIAPGTFNAIHPLPEGGGGKC